MRGRMFSLSRVLGASTVLAGLLLGLASVPASAAPAGSPTTADEAQRARVTGAAVEIVGLRTDTQRVYANPDGTKRAVFSVPADASAGDAGALSLPWGGTPNWTSITTQFPDTSYWMDSVARVGYLSDLGSSGVWRSLFQFNTSALAGKVIENAAFRITLAHSWSCQATPVVLWQTSEIDPETTWGNYAGPWFRQLGGVSASANSSCGQAPRQVVFNTIGVRNVIQDGALASSPTATFGLRAASETDVTQWKRFTANTARLEVVYSEPLPPETGSPSIGR